MRVLLINPPYQTLTSNLGVGHQIPLGLLAIGGPLLEAGHEAGGETTGELSSVVKKPERLVKML